MKKQKLEDLRKRKESKLKNKELNNLNIKNIKMFKDFSFISKLESKWSKEGFNLSVEGSKDFEIDCYKINKEKILFIDNKKKECVFLLLKNNIGQEKFEHEEEYETILYYAAGKKNIKVDYLKELDKIVFEYNGKEKILKEFKRSKEGLAKAKELFNNYLIKEF